MTGVRLYRRGVKRKVLQDEELPSTSKIINMQDKLDQYSATFQRPSDLLTRVQDNRYIPSAELWTVVSRNNFTPSNWYNTLTLCSPELPTSQPWPPPPNASPQKGKVVPYHQAKKVPPRLWEKQGMVKTARGVVSHWVLIHPGPPEEFDYFTALAESLPPLPSKLCGTSSIWQASPKLESDSKKWVLELFTTLSNHVVFVNVYWPSK